MVNRLLTSVRGKGLGDGTPGTASTRGSRCVAGRLVLLILTAVVAASSGCAWNGFAGDVEARHYSKRIILSADGSRAAYVWTDRCWSLVPWPPPMPIDTLAEAKTEWVGWCNPDGTNHLARIDGQLRVSGGYGNSYSVRSITFSPDGRHLAAALKNRIEIIDTATGDVQRLKGTRGRITSVCWFDNTQLAYATVSDSDQTEDGRLVRSVYRHAIDKAEPVRVFSRGSKRAHYTPFCESWAPDGRTVLLTEGRELWRLDVSSGASEVLVQAIPSADLPGEEEDGLMDRDMDWDINWSPDGRQVSVLASGGSGRGKLRLAGVLDCRSWEFTDLKEKFLRKVGDTWVRPILCTPDGFLLVTAPKPGRSVTYLVRCDPWQVIDFSQRYGDGLPRGLTGFQTVQQLIPGWLAVGPGEGDSVMTAVDYDGRRRVRIANHPARLSPDGRKLAEVVRKGKIVIRPVDLSGK